MDRLKQVVDEKNREFKRLKNSFEVLKSQNDDIKIQVNLCTYIMGIFNLIVLTLNYITRLTETSNSIIQDLLFRELDKYRVRGNLQIWGDLEINFDLDVI